MLLDTCVLSELIKLNPDAKVIAFFEALNDSKVFISSITLAELHRGIARLSDSKRKKELAQWLQNIEQQYANHILDFDRITAKIWGELTAIAQAHGKPMSFMDSMIAATAMQHQLSIVTRNISDFEHCHVRLVNPWV